MFHAATTTSPTGPVEEFSIRDRKRMAAIYSDVLACAGGGSVSREDRVVILGSLLKDAGRRRLDSFLSRERALAAMDRVREAA